MKNKIFATLFLAMMTLAALGQAKKPTLMIVPSDVWCSENGDSTTFNF